MVRVVAVSVVVLLLSACKHADPDAHRVVTPVERSDASGNEAAGVANREEQSDRHVGKIEVQEVGQIIIPAPEVTSALKQPVPSTATPKPLTVEDIEYYLKNKISCKLVAARISERGVNFTPDEKIRKRLKKAKADQRVLQAIIDANSKTKASLPEVSPPSRSSATSNP